MMTEIGVPAEGHVHSDSDDESFVILGRSVTPESYMDDDDDQIDNLNINVVEESMKLTETALSQLNSVNLEFKSMPSHYQQTIESVLQVVQERTSSPSPSVDLGPDEVLQKVNLLLEENRKLKDSLHQNNAIMKKQYEMLVSWQEEVMKIHTMHKEKFEMTKKFVENLKGKNVKLLQDLETSLATQDELKRELESLKSHTNVRESSSNSSNENAAYMEKRIEMLEKELAKEKSLHQKSIEVCRSKTREAETVQEILLEELKIMKANFNEQAAARNLNEQGNIQGDKGDQAQIETLQKTIEELQKLSFENELMIKTQSHDYVDAKILLEDHQKSIIDCNKTIQAQSQQIASLESNIGEHENTIKDAKEVIKQKCNHIERIQSELEQVITEKNKLSEKKGEVEELLSKEINGLNGTIQHLQEQIHTYRSDFDVERHVKDELKIENNRITEDLQALQRRNQQLLDEIEHLKNDSANSFVHVPACGTTSATYCCPICNFKFSDYQALENHVHRCMEVNSIF